MKKLSIIIPVWNSKTVDKAIASIPQSEEIEVLVIDGKSDQYTIDLIDQVKDRIDYFVSEKDNGLYDAMNKGIKKASGEWVFTLASDDQLLCDPISIINKYENQGSDLICGTIVAKDFYDRYFVMNPDNNLSRLDIDCSVFHPGTFFKRFLYDKYGMYDLQYRCAADHEYFVRLYRNSVKFLCVPELITFFAYGGISTNNLYLAYREDIKISDRYLVSKWKSRGFFIFRSLRHHIVKTVNRLGIRRINDRLMDRSGIKKLLLQHPEVVNTGFIGS